MRPRSMISMLLLCFGACSPGGGGGAGGGGAGGTGGLEPSACSEPPSQALSSPCCRGHGVDACGATLFCAAFDGRKQATCYPERSRLDGQECAADLHCISGSCNAERSACRATPGTACTPEVGCAKGVDGRRMVCAPAEGRCFPVGSGDFGEYCETDADCDRGTCEQAICTADRLCPDLEGEPGPCASGDDERACSSCRWLNFLECRDRCSRQAADLLSCYQGRDCDREVFDTACAAEKCTQQHCALQMCAEQACPAYVPCE